ncbi:MAG: hypothetical protein KDC10_10940 [Calditrichaeota bacterium]|nr:hypothetical protein [Calditrichota bacterium]
MDCFETNMQQRIPKGLGAIMSTTRTGVDLLGIVPVKVSPIPTLTKEATQTIAVLYGLDASVDEKKKQKLENGPKPPIQTIAPVGPEHDPSPETNGSKPN